MTETLIRLIKGRFCHCDTMKIYEYCSFEPKKEKEDKLM